MDPASGAVSGAGTGMAFGPWGALVGGGLGLLGSLFGNQPQQQNVTNTGDPALGAYLAQIRNLGMGAYNSLGANAKMDPNFLASMQSLGQMGGMGTEAMAALMGQNPAGQQAAMNPYMSAMNPVFDRMRQAAVSQANLSTTSPFGIGARQGLAASSALNGVGQQEASFNYQGFLDAMQHLMGVANLGLGATNAQQSGGQWATMLPMLWQQMRMGLLTPGAMSNGANGQQTTIPVNSNPFEMGLGGAIAGGSAANAWGQAGRTAPAAPPAGAVRPARANMGMGY